MLDIKLNRAWKRRRAPDVEHDSIGCHVSAVNEKRDIPLKPVEKNMLRPHMPSSDEPEGPIVPHELPDVIDAHVHVFPDGVFAAIWKWFDKHAWRIRYRMTTTQIFDFLLSRGIKHIIALQYAHKPGIAGRLNAYMVEKCRRYKDRVMYGSDFPNIPYAWDRELKVLEAAGLSYDRLERITYRNALELFSIKWMLFQAVPARSADYR